jgi:FkbM family methyltransferase
MPALHFDADQAWGALSPRGMTRVLIDACHALNLRLPGVARLLRQPVRYAARHALDVEVFGLQLRLSPRGNFSEGRLLFTPQLFERTELDWLAGHLGPASTFVDIGANAGGYSLSIRSRFGERIRILAFEPDPEMRRRLAFNLATNRIRNIEVCPVALSDTQGEAILELGDNRGENALVDRAASKGRGVTVPVDTLVNVLAARRVESVDALKIDVEGHEPRVLGHFFAHAPQALWPKALVTEYKDETGAGILDILQRSGYRRVGVVSQNWLFERQAV